MKHIPQIELKFTRKNTHIFAFFTGGAILPVGLSVPLTICANQTATINCASKLIVIENANFGRTFWTYTCDGQLQWPMCNNDVTCQVSKTCNFKESCQLTASSSTYAPNGDSCNNNDKGLEIRYRCMAEN